MVTSAITQYVALEDIKVVFSITSSDENLDDRLDIIIDDANAEVDTILYPYAEEIPIPPGNLLYQLGEPLAIAYVKMVWSMEQSEVDMYRQRRKIYEAKKASLIKLLIAQKHDRQQAISISGVDPLKNRLVLPSQKETFILD